MMKKPKKDPEEVLNEPVDDVSHETPNEGNNLDNPDSLSPGKVEDKLNPPGSNPVQPELDSLTPWGEKIKDIEFRKAEFKKELEASVEKWLIAPDTKIVRTNHGDKVGIILIDLKYQENVDEVFPSWEDEKAMNDIIQKTIVARDEAVPEQGTES